MAAWLMGLPPLRAFKRTLCPENCSLQQCFRCAEQAQASRQDLHVERMLLQLLLHFCQLSCSPGFQVFSDGCPKRKRCDKEAALSSSTTSAWKGSLPIDGLLLMCPAVTAHGTTSENRHDWIFISPA